MPPLPRRGFAPACLAWSTAGVAAATAATADLPRGPIRVVVPFGAGTGLDVIVRAVGEAFTRRTGSVVVVENREGAGGLIGATGVRALPPDGSNLLFTAHPPFAVGPLLQRQASYDPVADFAPLALLAVTPMVLVASNEAPFRDFAGMVAHARGRPNELDYASTGIGAPSHLNMERIARAEGLSLQHVPYANGSLAMTDTIAGRVSLYLPSFPAALPHIVGGRLRGLAIGSARRAEAAPDVPTMAEALRRPDFQATVWYGFLAPARLPGALVERLSAELLAAAATPEVQAALARAGADFAPLAAPEFPAQLRRDVE